jgi:hypothetical protein
MGCEFGFCAASSCATAQDAPRSRTENINKNLFICDLQVTCPDNPSIWMRLHLSEPYPSDTRIFTLLWMSTHTVVPGDGKLQKWSYAGEKIRISGSILISIPRRNVVWPSVFLMSMNRSLRVVGSILRTLDRSGFQCLVGVGQLFY